jgi:hypothetical protein
MDDVPHTVPHTDEAAASRVIELMDAPAWRQRTHAIITMDGSLALAMYSCPPGEVHLFRELQGGDGGWAHMGQLQLYTRFLDLRGALAEVAPADAEFLARGGWYMSELRAWLRHVEAQLPPSVSVLRKVS